SEVGAVVAIIGGRISAGAGRISSPFPFSPAYRSAPHFGALRSQSHRHAGHNSTRGGAIRVQRNRELESGGIQNLQDAIRAKRMCAPHFTIRRNSALQQRWQRLERGYDDASLALNKQPYGGTFDRLFSYDSLHCRCNPIRESLGSSACAIPRFHFSRQQNASILAHESSLLFLPFLPFVPPLGIDSRGFLRRNRMAISQILWLWLIPNRTWPAGSAAHRMNR
ncbi:hypothetical protein CTAM01_00577, partial [Colletotrichum tamarilloi]